MSRGRENGKSEEGRTNQNVENLSRQIYVTLERLQKLNIIDFYNKVVIEPVYCDGKRFDRLSWGNHKAGRTTGAAFLDLEQYFNILEDNSFLAILADYSIIRCSFTFYKNKLVSESLLWWPSPFQPDDKKMVEEFGLLDVEKSMMLDTNTIVKMKMRSPIRIDFDAEKDEEKHPMSHMHIENHETRINTNRPICFNQFMEFILHNFYPHFNVRFSRDDFISFSYEKGAKVKYANSTQLLY